MHSRCGPWQQPGTCWSLGRRAKLAVLDQPRWWTRYSSWRELLHPTKGNYIKQPRDLKMNVLGATQAAKVKIYQHLAGRVIPRSNPNFRPWPAKSAKHPGSLISCNYLWSIMIHHDPSDWSVANHFPWWNRCCGTASGSQAPGTPNLGALFLPDELPVTWVRGAQLGPPRKPRGTTWIFFWGERLWSNYMYIYISIICVYI